MKSYIQKTSEKPLKKSRHPKHTPLVNKDKYQTVKFGLRGERVPRAKISGSFSVCAKFFDRPISVQVFRAVCCVTRAVFKKGLQILLLPRTEQFQYNPSSSDLCMDGLMKQKQE